MWQEVGALTFPVPSCVSLPLGSGDKDLPQRLQERQSGDAGGGRAPPRPPARTPTAPRGRRILITASQDPDPPPVCGAVTGVGAEQPSTDVKVSTLNAWRVASRHPQGLWGQGGTPLLCRRGASQDSHPGWRPFIPARGLWKRGWGDPPSREAASICGHHRVGTSSSPCTSGVTAQMHQGPSGVNTHGHQERRAHGLQWGGQVADGGWPGTPAGQCFWPFLPGTLSRTEGPWSLSTGHP